MSNVASSSHFPMASVVYSAPREQLNQLQHLQQRDPFLQILNICKSKLLKRGLDWNLACILWGKCHTHEIIMLNTGLSALQTIVEWWLFIVWSHPAAKPFVDFNWIQQCQQANKTCIILSEHYSLCSPNLYIISWIRPGQVFIFPLNKPYIFCRIVRAQVYTIPRNDPTLSGDLLVPVRYYFTMLQCGIATSSCSQGAPL